MEKKKGRDSSMSLYTQLKTLPLGNLVRYTDATNLMIYIDHILPILGNAH